MSTKTENLKLTKPAATDIVDISAINENMDIIDENLATRAEMNTIKKNLDDSDAALKSGYESADSILKSNYESADASIRKDLRTASARIDNLVANTGDSNSEIVDARLDFENTQHSTLRGSIVGSDTKLNIRIKNEEMIRAMAVEGLENKIGMTNSRMDDANKRISSLRLYRDDEGYLCEMEE